MTYEQGERDFLRAVKEHAAALQQLFDAAMRAGRTLAIVAAAIDNQSEAEGRPERVFGRADAAMGQLDAALNAVRNCLEPE